MIVLCRWPVWPTSSYLNSSGELNCLDRVCQQFKETWSTFSVIMLKLKLKGIAPQLPIPDVVKIRNCSVILHIYLLGEMTNRHILTNQPFEIFCRATLWRSCLPGGKYLRHWPGSKIYAGFCKTWQHLESVLCHLCQNNMRIYYIIIS